MEDIHLVEEYLKGNDEAFRSIVEIYTPSIYNYSVHLVGREYSNDLVQDIFIKIWKNIKKFDPQKASFKTWIFNITRNTIIDYLRKKKTVNFSMLNSEEEDFASQVLDDKPLSDEVLMKFEDSQLLNQLIDNLPDHYKEVLILHYQEDMTFAEIGELLNKPLNTVKSYHFRALKLLRINCTNINH